MLFLDTDDVFSPCGPEDTEDRRPFPLGDSPEDVRPTTLCPLPLHRGRIDVFSGTGTQQAATAELKGAPHLTQRFEKVLTRALNSGVAGQLGQNRELIAHT